MAATNTTAHRFTSETAKKASEKSVAARRAKAAAAAALPTELAQKLGEVRSAFATVELGETVLAVAGVVMARLANGEIPVRNGGEAADLLRALHEIARLEAGQPTSLSASVTIPAGEAMARLAELQQRARATLDGGALPVLSSAASAADDGDGDQGVHHPSVVVADGGEDPAPARVESPVSPEGSTPHPR